jgi:hypothetical protein
MSCSSRVVEASRSSATTCRPRAHGREPVPDRGHLLLACRDLRPKIRLDDLYLALGVGRMPPLDRLRFAQTLSVLSTSARPASDHVERTQPL